MELFVANLEQHDIHLLSLWDEDYPVLLKESFNPPAVLFYQGVLPESEKMVAMVGARKATPYGVNAAHTFALELAREGVVIVSGGARGIDTKAHRGALDGGGVTVAVVANGLDICYPKSNKKLFYEIVEKGGAVISEYPPGMEPLAGNFPARNRIIAGLAKCTIVVEAAKRSGSLITSDFALEEGRDVFAIPGSIYSTESKGTNWLLRHGAIALTEPGDVLTEYGWNVSDVKESSRTRPLSFQELLVLQALSCDSAVSSEELVARTALAPPVLGSVLLGLQLDGLIEELRPGLYFKRG